MPLYEYTCEEDGTTLTLLRSMAQADDPVEDPDGGTRIYRRVHSTFQTAQNGAGGCSTSSTGPSGCSCCG